MDAFEAVVARLFEVRGYWTRIGMKVELTKEQKRSLENPSMPRPEVDIVAFKPGTNEILVIECKSYLDSTGVRIEQFSHGGEVDRFKMFNRAPLRDLVKRNLITQLRSEGLLPSFGEPTVRLVLVAGRIYSDHEARIRTYFEEQGWLLIGPSEIAESLKKFVDRGYENDLVTIVTKILLRNPGQQSPQVLENSEVAPHRLPLAPVANA